MLTSRDVKEWLEGVLDATKPLSLGGMGDIPVFTGPFIEVMPDRIVTVTITPGTGYSFEGAADQCGFQARVRGKGSANYREAYSDAERMAMALDSLIFSAAFPVVLPDGKLIARAYRLGGQPAPLAPAPDDGDRFEFVCNYVVITGVGPNGG